MILLRSVLFWGPHGTHKKVINEMGHLILEFVLLSVENLNLSYSRRSDVPGTHVSASPRHCY